MNVFLIGLAIFLILGTLRLGHTVKPEQYVDSCNHRIARAVRRDRRHAAPPPPRVEPDRGVAARCAGRPGPLRAPVRYVETASVDAGLNMVQNGFAVARYDSRDGYGAHTREGAYVAADASSPNVCAFDPTTPAPAPAPAPPAPSPGRRRLPPQLQPVPAEGGRPGLRRDRRPPQAGARHRRLRSLPARRRRGRLRLRRRLTAGRGAIPSGRGDGDRQAFDGIEGVPSSR